MWIMEQPLTIAFVGIVVVILLTAGLLQTGRHSLLYAAITAALLTVALVIIERMVVTPREQISATLHVIADRLQQNDVEGVVEFVSSGKPKLREEARRKMDQFTVHDVEIKRNLKIDLLAQQGRELADVSFNAILSLEGYGVEFRRQPLFFVLKMRSEDGQWRVREYEVQDPRRGL